jgi:ABC-type dipeptide/oligopeptide/nickel transport system permease component
MLVQILFAAALLLIVASLAWGLYAMLSDRSDSDRMARALSWRIGLSIAAFVLLLVAGWSGWIEPNAVRPG